MLVRCHATHFQRPCHILGGQGLPVVSINGAEPNFDPFVKRFRKRCLQRVTTSSTWQLSAATESCGKAEYRQDDHSYSTGRYLERHLSMVDCPYICMVSKVYSCGLALQSTSNVNLFRVTARPCKMPRRRTGSITKVTSQPIPQELQTLCTRAMDVGAMTQM